ncbi:PAAR domain-containing protein [Streptomyces sp. 8N706]|uniref:PAAR domain-containing protein n=1 Tax=Streptomyces sp. 8N706 TaxID=3457416 RepID=UPI003FD64983
MSGNFLHVNATILCPHGGMATVLPAQSRVLVNGRPVASVADTVTVTGCPYTVGNKPQPCTSVRWSGTSGRVRVHGSPALLQGSTAQCYSAEQIPQGPPTVSVVQQRAVGR